MCVFRGVRERYKEGVVGAEETTQGRTRAAQMREGVAAGTDTVGSTTCTN